MTNPQKVFCCHSYGCQVRGNLLSLMHGWLTGTRPTGEKLKGNEFTRVRDALVGKPAAPSPAPSAAPTASTPAPAPSKPTRNLPLAQSDNDKARELVTIDEKFVIDVAIMSPAAASYVRRHSCLSPASMTKWRIGFLPADGGGDKRGWSLRGQLLYPILSEDGQVLAWVGRDPQFEAKDIAFNALTSSALWLSFTCRRRVETNPITLKSTGADCDVKNHGTEHRHTVYLRNRFWFYVSPHRGIPRFNPIPT